MFRFQMSDEGLSIFRPDGNPFETFEQLGKRADQERQRADQERQRADQANQRLARLAELARKVRSGQATPEELLEALEAAPPPPEGQG